MSFGGRTDREVYNNFIVALRDELQKRGVVDRVEYFGSRYKGTDVGSSDYDNMFVKVDKTIQASPHEQFDSYSELTTRSGQPVDRQSYLEKFREELQNSLRAIGALSVAQITRSFNAASVVSYRRSGDKPFTVDIVYGLDIGDGQIFVAKPPPRSQPNAWSPALWYFTQVLAEKNKMQTIDKDNGVGKQAVRRLKRLKEREPSMQVILSFVFEQVLMYLKDDRPDPLFWRENNMPEILRAFLLYMIKALEQKELRQYFNRSNNTIGNLSDYQRNQMINRFTALSKDPNKVMALTN